MRVRILSRAHPRSHGDHDRCGQQIAKRSHLTPDGTIDRRLSVGRLACLATKSTRKSCEATAIVELPALSDRVWHMAHGQAARTSRFIVASNDAKAGACLGKPSDVPRASTRGAPCVRCSKGCAPIS